MFNDIANATKEDIELKIQQLRIALEKERKELADVRTEYYQAENCLQNWQARFALDEAFQSYCLASNELQKFFVAPIGTIFVEEDIRTQVRIELNRRFEGSCTDLESWDKIWVIGLTSNESYESLSSSKSICSSVDSFNVPGVALNCDETYNNTVHISNYLISNYNKTQQSVCDEHQDPYTLGISPRLSQYLDAAGAQPTNLRLINLLGNILSIRDEGSELHVELSEPPPQDFILLDLKVYHPYIESITRLPSN